MSNVQCPISNVHRGVQKKSGFPEIAGAVSILNLTSIELEDSLLMKYDLQERLIGYSALILEIVNSLPDNKATNHLANQMIRSGTAPCLMYGEAQSSESTKDFIHKMRLPLKELRETYNCLRILSRLNCQEMPNEGLVKAINETDELIAIFAKSVDTAIKNSNAKD